MPGRKNNRLNWYITIPKLGRDVRSISILLARVRWPDSASPPAEAVPEKPGFLWSNEVKQLSRAVNGCAPVESSLDSRTETSNIARHRFYDSWISGTNNTITYQFYCHRQPINKLKWVNMFYRNFSYFNF